MPKTKKSRSTKKTTQTTPKRSVFGNRIFFLLIVAVFILAVLNKWIAEERVEQSSSESTKSYSKDYKKTEYGNPSESMNITKSELFDELEYEYDPSVFMIERLQQQVHFDLITNHQFPALQITEKETARPVVTLIDFSMANQEKESLEKAIKSHGMEWESKLNSVEFLGNTYAFAATEFGEGGPRSEDCWGGGGTTTNYFVSKENVGVIVEYGYTEEGCEGQKTIRKEHPSQAVVEQAIQVLESARK